MNDDDDGDRFELYNADGREWFRLIWREQMLMRSHGEATRERAREDIERLRSSTTTLRACMTASGRFYFTAQTVGGDVLATSRSFELPAERDAAMEIAARLVQGGAAVRIVDP